MNFSKEGALWESAGVGSLSELSDFPFADYEKFVASVRGGETSIGIEYGAARSLVHVTKSRKWQYALLTIGAIPGLFIPASIGFAIVTGYWAALIGIPVAVVAMLFASPYNPLRGLFFLVSMLSLVYCVIHGTVLTSGTWVAFAFGLSFLAIRYLNRTAWNWAYRAVLVSEALTAFLWKTGNLHVRSKNPPVKPGRDTAGWAPRGRVVETLQPADSRGAPGCGSQQGDVHDLGGPHAQLQEATQDLRTVIECPECGQRLRVPTGQSGSIRCPKCQCLFPSST